MDISGNATFENSDDGFFIGNTVYDNIEISGINFNVSSYGIGMENRTHTTPLTQASVNVHHNTFNQGVKGIKYDNLNETPTQFSPYASAENNTAIDLTSFLIDVPLALVNAPLTQLNSGINPATTPTIQLLGNNEISRNALINCSALSPPDQYQHYNSPSDNAYQNVTDPYLGGTGNFETEDMKFMPGTFIPQENSPLNLGNGEL